ncbi:MAG: hypothetical protein ACR2KB_08295, partial [Chitinophagaceae bacterium]
LLCVCISLRTPRSWRLKCKGSKSLCATFCLSVLVAKQLRREGTRSIFLVKREQGFYRKGHKESAKIRKGFKSIYFAFVFLCELRVLGG